MILWTHPGEMYSYDHREASDLTTAKGHARKLLEAAKDLLEAEDEESIKEALRAVCQRGSAVAHALGEKKMTDHLHEAGRP